MNTIDRRLRYTSILFLLTLAACGGGESPDASLDGSVDVAPDVTRADAPADAPADVTRDASIDVTRDAATDVPRDTPRDVPQDTGPLCNADAGLVACGATCVDLQTDPAHCGTCSHSCTAIEACTAGSCAPVCRIAGTTYAANAPDPSNPCQHCDPAVSPTDWSPLPDGTDCGGGQLCAAGVCATQCVITGTAYAPAAPNPANACEACDPSVDPRAWSPLADNTPCGTNQFCAGNTCTSGCVIAGAFYPAGSNDPTNACEACTPATATDAWTPVADGTACGTGSVCSAGTCQAGCFIAGTYYADGALRPGNDCYACNASTSTTAWTARADGSVCGMGQYCDAAVCVPTWHGSMPTGLTPMYGGSAAAGNGGRVFLFGGVVGGSATALMQIYNPATNTFTRGPDVPYVSYRSCAVTAPSGRIYVIGGGPPPGYAAINTVVRYDPTTNTYAAGPNMPIAGYEHSCSLGLDGNIYAFITDDAARPGDFFVTSHTLILNPTTGVWTTGAPMPSPRQRTTAVTLPDGRIAVTGGNRGYIFGALSAINEIYSPSTNTWTAAAPMPVLTHWNVSALRADGRMITTGGLTPAGTVMFTTYVYDPITDVWMTGTEVTDNHYAAYIARTPDKRVYVLTGRGLGSTMSSTVDVLY